MKTLALVYQYVFWWGICLIIKGKIILKIILFLDEIEQADVLVYIPVILLYNAAAAVVVN